VIVLDVNILLYAYNKNASQHLKARTWIEQKFSGSDPVGLPWHTISAFARITTSPNLAEMRRTIPEATRIIDQWTMQPNVHLLSPGEKHWFLFRQMIVEGQAPGALVSDAHLAALTIEYGGVLHTTDRDFSRFPGLRWINPLLN